MRKSALLLLLVVGMSAAQVLRAQSAADSQGVVRYHYGDDAAWSSASFDDSSWPVAANDQVPQPAFDSDGYFWVRVRIAVPSGLAGPLGIQSIDPLSGSGVEQIFVNGAAVGVYGDFPPHESARLPIRSLTFPIPGGVASSGTTAVVAIRGWSKPVGRISSGEAQASPYHVALSIDRLSVLTTAARADAASAFLATLPPIIPNVLLLLLGIALLAIFRGAAGRELVLNAIWLIGLPLFLIPDSLEAARLVSPFFTARGWLILYTITVIPGFWVTPELLWTVFGFRDRVVRGVAHATWIVFVVGDFLDGLPHHPARWIPPLFATSQVSLTLFNAICLGATLWALFVSRRNRIIAAAFSLINITYLLAIAGIPLTLHIGPVAFVSQVVGFVVAGLTITATLVYRAVAGWRAGLPLGRSSSNWCRLRCRRWQDFRWTRPTCPRPKWAVTFIRSSLMEMDRGCW